MTEKYETLINNLKDVLKDSKFTYYYKNLHKFNIYIEYVNNGVKYMLFTKKHNFSQSFIIDVNNNLI